LFEFGILSANALLESFLLATGAGKLGILSNPVFSESK
jgi:hypothetical protein